MHLPSQASLLIALHIGLAVWSVYHALLYKRDPRSAMGWIMACVFVPYGGPLAYYIFGINRVKSRARGIHRRIFQVDYEIGDLKAPHEGGRVPGIRAVGHRVTGRSATTGNRVQPLLNGDTAYPHMLAAIAQAQRRVLLATYIMNVDTTGLAFAQALEQAVKRGVDVKVLLDGFGELYSWRRMRTVLKKRGIRVARFLPPKLLPPSVYVNLRNHRKLLLVDNTVAYAGGMNISDENTMMRGADTDRARSISDIQFTLQGPVLNELAQLFYRDWQFATGERPPVEHLDAEPVDGDMACRLVPDSPDEELDTLALTLETVISAAHTSVDVMTPYFLPNRELMTTLQCAALRGARVRIVLPQKNNLFFVHWANRNILADLLIWGVEAYYQPAPFCHSKILCIDEQYTLIGSANLDQRSLRLNFELGIEVFSNALNASMRAHIDATIATSHRITYDELTNRSIPARLRDSAVALFSPYL